MASSNGAVRTAVFPAEDQAILPARLPAKTAPTTGRGTRDWAAVLLTSSHPVTPLLLSATTTGSGPTTLSAATLPRPLPTLPTHPHRLVNPMTVTMTRRMVKTARGTNASLPRSVSTAPVTLQLALRASLLALFLAWLVVITSALTPLPTLTTAVVVLSTVRARTATPSLAFGTLDASKAPARSIRAQTVTCSPRTKSPAPLSRSSGCIFYNGLN